jgi:hypothetical protein
LDVGWDGKEKEGTWGMLREIDLKKNVLSVVTKGREKFLSCGPFQGHRMY